MSDRRWVSLRRGHMGLAVGSMAAAALWLGGCGGDDGPGVAGSTATTGAAVTGTSAPGPMGDGGVNATTGTSAGTTGATAGTATAATGTTSGTTGTVGAGSGVPGPSCDVAAIFQAKCGACHGDPLAGGAPMSLVTHADFQGMGPVTMDQTILSLVGARIRDTQRPMPPTGTPALTEEEKAAIEAWIAAGAPSDNGQGCGTAEGGETGGATSGDATEKEWPPPDATDCYEILSHGSGGKDSPMIVEAGSETHPQVIHDAPWGSEPMEAVGFRPITDNAKVLHHWILYENSDGGFGGAFLNGWAPGKGERNLPDDVAIYMPSGPGSLRLDMHYYNRGGGTDEEDNSGVEVCVAPKGTREHTATTYSQFSQFLLSLPPQEETDEVGYCTVDADHPITVLSVSPHMHEHGRHMKMEVKRAEGGIEVWHDAPFDFEDQQVYPLDKQLYPGDSVKTTCSYRNTSNETVTFGQNTNDEMCFNFVLYYPMGGMSCSGGFFGGSTEQW